MLAVALVWGIAGTLALVIWHRKGKEGLTRAGGNSVQSLKSLAVRLPAALLAASFLIQIVPVESVSRLIGADSGTLGIVIAAAIGGFLPGGPMTSFPIALVFQQGGAGLPQLIALIAGWSIFAFHRLLAYEAPIMGWRFVALRSASCFILPVLAGLFTQVVIFVLGIT